MIDVKQAIANSKAFARDVLRVSDLMLEEVRSAHMVEFHRHRTAGTPRRPEMRA
jgi:hypothetical protein